MFPCFYYQRTKFIWKDIQKFWYHFTLIIHYSTDHSIVQSFSSYDLPGRQGNRQSLSFILHILFCCFYVNCLWQTQWFKGMTEVCDVIFMFLVESISKYSLNHTAEKFPRHPTGKHILIRVNQGIHTYMNRYITLITSFEVIFTYHESWLNKSKG